MALAAVVPLSAGAGYLVWRSGTDARYFERERFRFAGRELVRELEEKALVKIKEGKPAEIPDALAAELKPLSSRLGLGAALMWANGDVMMEEHPSSRPVPQAGLSASARELKSGSATRLVVEGCGLLCERKAGVSAIANSDMAVAFWLSHDSTVMLRRTALEVILLAVVAVFSAAAVGIHMAAPVREVLDEIRKATEQIKQGNFGHKISARAAGDFGKVLDDFSAVASEIKTYVETITVRDKESWSQYEKESQRTTRMGLRMAALEAMAGAGGGPRAPQLLLADWFDQEGKAAGHAMEIQGGKDSWPAGEAWLCGSLLMTLDAALASGEGPYRLAIGGNGWQVEFLGKEGVDLEKVLAGASKLARGAGARFELTPRGKRTIVSVVFKA
jgi:hypothetical protein